MPSSKNKVKNKIVFAVINGVLSFIYFFLFIFSYSEGVTYNGWATVLGVVGLLTLFYELFIFFIFYKGKVYDLFFLILIFSYLFTFGRIFLVGIFGVNVIYSEGLNRPVIEERYAALWNIAGWFVLSLIQGMFFGYCLGNHDQRRVDQNKTDPQLHNIGCILLFVGLACLILDVYRMVKEVSSANSYDSVTSSVGLIDDFALCFTIPGLLCMLSSGVVTKKISFVLSLIAAVVALMIMVVTGDRRYETTAMVALVALYLRFRTKPIPIPIGIISMLAVVCGLNLFDIIRNYRYGGLSLILINISLASLFSPSFIFQTLYEFGNTMLTVVYTLGCVPSILSFRYGATILSSLLNIIPLGFLYQTNTMYKFGYLSIEVMSYFKTTVGASIWQDLWGNFGFFSIFLIPFVGAGIHKIDRLDKSGNRLRTAIKYSLLFVLVNLPRASITEITRPTVWITSSILLLYFLYSFILNKNSLKTFQKYAIK
jgi:hypothetical protein